MKWYSWVLIIIIIIMAASLINRERVMKDLKKIRLGKNFTLDEFVVTATGIENIPGEKEIKNLRELVENILQPLRDALGKAIIINSGYRSPAVNKAIGGAGGSQHLEGKAADFKIVGMTNQEIINVIRALKLPYDQLIDEVSGKSAWIHVSHNTGKPQRMEWLTFRNGKYDLIKTGLS
jgi:zinc D-Ala-D-Ala carboxypeptidase